MRKLFYSAFCIFFFFLKITAQNNSVISGPMLGQVELRMAKIWLEVSSQVKNVAVEVYNKKEQTNKKFNKIFPYYGELGKEFNPIQFVIGGLNINTTYSYRIWINGKPTDFTGDFITKDLWQWRKPAPNFSFLTGSCAYFNQPGYDRPGKPYGGDSSIFESMAKEEAEFMLWLGDNWYTREVDYYSEWGLWYRAHHDRAQPVLQKFLKAMPHYAIWDDHDFGSNDIGKNYILKDASRNIFMKYFCNPSYGANQQGIYTMLSFGDADFFMTDDRWWRSPNDLPDSINGKPNPDKKMLGAEQMEWLENSLIYSIATFKIIVVGSQVLNPVSPYDRLGRFPVEYNELMNFLQSNKIDGVLFLTGDRHHSEIIKVDRKGSYSLYDITVSPLTSGTHKFSGPEAQNSFRVLGIDEKQNYAKFNFTGKKGERKLTVEFFGVKGEKLGQWSITETELKGNNIIK